MAFQIGCTCHHFDYSPVKVSAKWMDQAMIYELQRKEKLHPLIDYLDVVFD